MRFLIVPLMGASGSSINSESDFLVYRHLIDAFADIGANAYFYFLLPEKAKKHVTDAEMRHSNFEYLFDDIWSGMSFYDQVSLPSKVVDLFHPVYGTRPIDMIITSRSHSAMYMRRLFMDRSGVEIPVGIIEPKVSSVISSLNHNETFFIDMMSRVSGYCTSLNLFSTEVEKAEAIRACARYASPAMVKQMSANSVIMPLGLRIGELDSVISSTPKKEKFTLFWGGRMNANKRYDDVIRLMDKFYAFGRNVEILVNSTLSETGKFGELKKKCFVKGTGGNLSREEYLKTIASCHIGLCMSNVEGCPVGFIEQVYCGIVLILPKRDWVRGVFGTEYPFVYDTEDEAYILMRYIYENYEEAKKKMVPVLEMIRTKYFVVNSVRILISETQKYIKQFNDKCETLFYKGWRTLTDEILIEKEMSFSQIVARIKEKAEMPAQVCHQTQMCTYLTQRDLYKYIIEKGYVDKCDSPEPVFVKS
ncbi:MAG: glycosyltransferase [Nitrospirae bacterium]|nr:glycosyltransferase [Nitrospirota bacterium]